MVTYPSWEEKRLSDLGTFTKGAPLSKADISTSGTPFILYGELYTTYHEVTNTVFRRTDRTVDDKYYSRVGDVIIPTSGETAEEIATATCVMLQNVILAGDLYIYRTSKVDGRFLSFIINHVINRKIAEIAQGISVVHIQSKELGKIIVKYPPLPEQQAIASTLTAFDTYIDDLAELIEKKKAIRDGALEDLVGGGTRLDGFDGEWTEQSIQQLTTDVITGGTPSTSVSDFWDGDIPWLASTEIHQKRIKQATRYITSKGLNNSSAKIAPAKAVLIALAGQGKTRGTAAILMSSMAINQSLAALVAHEKTDAYFLFYLIENNYLNLRELSSGDGGRGGLSKKLIKGLMFNVPTDTKEQEAIGCTLKSMDAEIADLEAEREKMIQIREGAMDDLLTGRIRLKA